MKPVATFKVRPLLPEVLQPLMRIAYNLRWSWDAGAVQLFLRLDRDLWEASGHNPVLLLGSVDQGVLESAAQDDSFLAHLKGVVDKLDEYTSGVGTWYGREHQHISRRNLGSPNASRFLPEGWACWLVIT
jgi:glycogen phosphorylase